jgi:hypothetical protein
MPKQRRGPVKLPDAHKLFIHAETFRVTSELLWKEWKDGKVCYAYAFFANDAFCCELFLKCLAAVRAREHPPGHKLDDLFNALHPQDQDCVERHYERLSAGDPEHIKAGKESPSKSNALRDFLKDGADVFDLIRYSYERPFPHRRGNFHYPILAIREAILEIHPHWRLQSDRWTKPKSAIHRKPKPGISHGSIVPVRIRLLVPRNLSL